MPPTMHSSAGRCVEAVLADVGPKVVLGIPIGIGKPNQFVNALFRRAVQDPAISLKIFTGLTFVKPSGASELERRFAAPLIERLFGGYPDLEYVAALKTGQLPPNIEIHEFFFQAGAFLNVPLAQQAYTSLDYTYVAKHVLDLGVNVIAQLIGKRGTGAAARYSWSSNTDITLDILPELIRRRSAGERIAVVGQVNGAMPFMTGEAEAPASAFDHILEDAAHEFPLFAPPKQPVALQDYASALHVAALVKDGGTVQLGIGGFSDALTHALILRQKQNARFAELLKLVRAGRLHPRLSVETAPFEKGLYGATELFVDGYLSLYRAGVLKRRVFGDLDVQRRADAGELSAEEYERGVLLHAGFFFGANSFYQALRDFTGTEASAFQMTAISFVNQLYGGEALKRAQRRHARFINSAMMATLLGEVISDRLGDGRVVSGVGGQYNFVAQARELEDGRSIIELHASRLEKGRPRSNIRWAYDRTTIPGHLRDIIVTEYGAADLRGLSDRDTIAAMLNIADSRFQDELLRAAKAARKIERGYEIPGAFRGNTPEQVEAALRSARADGTLPDFPLGTDMTTEEIALLPALIRLKNAENSPLQLLRLLGRGKPWASPRGDERPLLSRMGLLTPTSAKQHLYAALLRGALRPG